MNALSSVERPPSEPASLFPDNLHEALQQLRQHPDAEIWAGGTHVIRHHDRSRPILAIQGIQELRRAVRREDHLEVGCAVSLGRLRLLGDRFLPEVLLQALNEVGPPSLQNTATIGGLLLIPGAVLPLALVLRLLGARIELRRHGGSRWALLSGEQCDLASELNRGELATRIRVPVRRWTHWMSHSFGNPYPPGSGSVTTAAVLAVDKQTISDVRIASVYDSTTIMRNRELEAELVGKRHPLRGKSVRVVEEQFRALDEFTNAFPQLARHRAIHGLIAFLQQR